MKSFVARSRWAAVGAAVAVSLGGGAVFVANAVGQQADSFVAIEPCRLLDTREDSPASSVDGRIGPLDDRTLDQLGDNDITVYFDAGAVASEKMGDCDLAIEDGDVPLAIVMNVTVLNASAGSFVTIYPWEVMTGDYDLDEIERPFISQLNPWPAHPPITNTVTVGLGIDAGDIDFRVGNPRPEGTGWRALRLYNHVGRVHVVLDVVGYYIA